MTDKKLIFKNYLFFIIGATLLSSFQTSLWVTHLNGLPSPNFWMPTLAFWALYRHEKEFLIMIYLITLILSPLSGIPLGLFLLNNTIITLVAYFVKQRLYQPGVIFYMLICGAMTMSYPFIYWLLSHLLEENPINSFSIYNWMMQTLLTTLVALPLYMLYVWIDDVTQMELPTETGRQFQ
ncbi:MAG: hypothetical protein KDD50_14030 [Bdellovibrionales bacterium]|nr:hypothetical protein [Bdellovibrionales bacterium]